MRISPTVRGLLIIVAIAAVITVFQLQLALGVVLTILRILFIAAIVFFLFTLWRSRRHEIAMWSRRAQVVFYGGAALAIVDVAAAFATPFPVGGLQALAFFAVLAGSGYAMVRVWRDQHAYGY